MVTAAVSLTDLTAFILGRLSQFFRFHLQSLIEGFLDTAPNQFFDLSGIVILLVLLLNLRTGNVPGYAIFGETRDAV